MKPLTHFFSITILLICFSTSSHASCNLNNSFLVSQTGQEYPILSIRDCFGLEKKGTHFPKECLTYQQAEIIGRKYKSYDIMGSSIVEIRYNGERIYLMRWESVNASPTLAWFISRKLSADEKKFKQSCKLPYSKCDYYFEPKSSYFDAELPPKYEKLIEADQSNRNKIIEEYYGKIVTEGLGDKSCLK